MSSARMPVRFGVIGCGGMASQVHCPNMAAIPGAKTAAYCDIEEDKAKAWDLDAHLPVDSFPAVLTFADRSVHTYLQRGRSCNALLLCACRQEMTGRWLLAPFEASSGPSRGLQTGRLPVT